MLRYRPAWERREDLCGETLGRGGEGVQTDVQDQISESLAHLQGEKPLLWNSKDRMTELELRSCVAVVKLLSLSVSGEAARVQPRLSLFFFVYDQLNYSY